MRLAETSASPSRGHLGITLPAWSVYDLGAWFLVLALAVPWVVRWQGFLRAPVPDVEASEPRAIRPALLRLPGGLFQMGSDQSAYDDENPAHWVQISPFELCQTEVTQSQWQAVMGSNPSDCNNAGCGDDKPVQNVSWFDAVEYLNRLTELEGGLSLCYQREGDKVTWTELCTGFRLPTEAEWEYAARARARSAYSFGKSEFELPRFAWFEANSNGRVHDVATREPNIWRLYDMHGNVWEWVWDWKAPYRAAPREQPERDPRGPDDGDPSIEKDGISDGKDSRALRGGGFLSGAWSLRSAYRVRVRPTFRFRSYGFRCARGVPPALSH